MWRDQVEIGDSVVASHMWAANACLAERRSWSGGRKAEQGRDIKKQKAARKPLFRSLAVASDQVNAKASKLEHRSAKPPAVSARNPSETKSLLRMMHPPILNARPN
jgi:hypothetical protein